MRVTVLRALAVAFLLLGLGPRMAQADIIRFVFPINTEQEVPPPNIPQGFDPGGLARVLLDTDANTLAWDITYEGLTGNIAGAGAHFHGPADFGSTAPVRIFLAGGSSNFPLPQPPSGRLFGSASITDEQEAQILAGLWYVNIHTALNPPGEIRGQVVQAIIEVPEPSSLLCLVAGGLVFGGSRWLRRSRR